MPQNIKKFIRQWILPFGDPRKPIRLFGIPGFLMKMRAYKQATKFEKVQLADAYPIFGDDTTTTPFDPHYFYQGAWLARRLAVTNPEVHLDVASSVIMVSTISAHTPVIFVDYRPLRTNLTNIQNIAGNATELPFADNSFTSISCLHVVEHIGLGRYGDPVDPEGTLKAVRELARVLAVGGKLYLSLPVGVERVCFNAHRVMATETIVSMMSDLKLVSFSLVDDAGQFFDNCAIHLANGLDYGCGMFEFEKTS